MNINLCELLEGHEGETFYSPICGEIKFIGIDFTKIYPIGTNRFYLNNNGKWNDDGEVMIFPSKDQRDWDKWAKEQKSKTPKTWSELKECNVEILAIIREIAKYRPLGEPINKAALALLKIYQLIEVGYGGNITNEEWNDSDIEKFIIVPTEKGFKVDHRFKLRAFRHVAFHTAEQANEFLSYPENIQLVKDFYMI